MSFPICWINSESIELVGSERSQFLRQLLPLLSFLLCPLLGLVSSLSLLLCLFKANQQQISIQIPPAAAMGDSGRFPAIVPTLAA
jgi:hypothetical protein